MSVPEAAVDEYHGAVFGEDDVGPSWEGFVFRTVDGETVAETVKHRAQGPLRLRVAPTDAGHDLGALLWGEDVHAPYICGIVGKGNPPFGNRCSSQPFQSGRFRKSQADEQS